MIQAPIPSDEAGRLEALDRYEVLDTAPEARFDRVTRLAQTIFGVPIALVSLVDRDRQWFKSCIGLGVLETGRDVAFCSHAILGDGVMEVLDPQRDPRFFDNPLVTGDPHIRYYAGAPLVTPDGYALGTLCIIDQERREPLTAHERRTLRDLASLVVDDLELRRFLGAAKDSHRVAADANRTKAEFLAWLSHELKTPLTAISGFADTLLLTDLDEAQTQFASMILRAGHRVDGLINDILDFARIEAGRLTVAALPVELGPLTAESVTLLAERAAERLITVDVDPALHEHVVVGDERRIGQILVNLLSNAIKYNRESGRVTVGVRTDGTMVAVDVTDTGAGIAPDDRERIFAPYERVEGTGQPGAGVGLALSQWLAREMGGDITLRSEMGVGSTFTLTLPGTAA